MLFAEKKIGHGCARVTSEQQTSQTASENVSVQACVCSWIDCTQMSMYDTHECHQSFKACTLGWNLTLVTPSETCSGLFSCVSCC